MKQITFKALFLFGFLFLLLFCQNKQVPVKRDINHIIFLSDRESPRREFDIFRMNPDGTGQINLTAEIGGIRSYSAPRVSPDGEEILYIAFTGGKRSLNKITIEGKDEVKLTEIITDMPDARYSPSGDLIVFVDKPGQYRQIFTMNRDGSDRKNLSGNEKDEIDPVFSPDGSTIVFSTKTGDNFSLCMMNRNGSDRKILTSGVTDDRNPCFSPNGSSIVYSSAKEGNSDIYSIELRRRKIRQIYSNSSYETDPQFSPDGRNIIFISNYRGMKYRDVLLTDIRTAKVRNLTPGLNYVNQNATFVSDDRVIFESVQFANSEIYAADPVKGDLINLSNHPKWDCYPVY